MIHLPAVSLAAAVLAAVLGGTAVLPATAQPLPEIALEEVAGGLNELVYLTHAGDDRLFLVVKDGRVLILEGGMVRATPFLDISSRVRSTGVEQGLTSIAFHPEYGANGFFYVHYVQANGDTVLARYRVTGNPDVADPGSEARLLVIGQPFSNHNGGQLQFGPDGFLYLGTGDGGAGFDPQCRSQADDSFLGKFLRLDVNQNVGSPPFYGIPADNPFVGPGDPPDEIWAKGLRNPWRFSFDRATGDLYVGDVGQNEREEIDFQPAGAGAAANYGWKMLEGALCLGSSDGCPTPLPPCGSAVYTAPILELTHPQHCSVIGGYVYRGSSLPGFQGRYLYGDFCSGTLRAAHRQGESWTQTVLTPILPGQRSFGEDRDGELYVLTSTTVHRLILAGGGTEPGVIELTAAAVEIAEGAGQVTLRARRRGGSDGAVSVTFATADGTAQLDRDYLNTSGSLSWGDGQDGERTLTIPLVDDLGVEPDRSFTVSLSAPTGGAELGSPTTATITILDDDVLPPPCTADATTLCLQGDRFSVTMTWRTPRGSAGLGRAIELTDDTGYFWFFQESNVEVVVKVLDACVERFRRFWVFAGGLTNVEATLVVIDTATGFQRTYANPLGTPFEPIQDVQAFATCP